MDDILFSRSFKDCQRFCDDARAFNCKSYAQKGDRCYLSGDDSITLQGVPQPVEIGAIYKEKVCTRSKFDFFFSNYQLTIFDDEIRNLLIWIDNGFSVNQALHTALHERIWKTGQKVSSCVTSHPCETVLFCMVWPLLSKLSFTIWLFTPLTEIFFFWAEVIIHTL